jgi:hypothetical protein
VPEYNAGDARLRIVPDASGFRRDLEDKLKAIHVDFTVNVNVALAQARADMERFRAQQDGVTIGQRVAPQLTRAREEMARFRAEQRAQAINVPVTVDPNTARNSARRAVGDISREIGSVASAAVDLSKVMGITTLVANIPAAITAVAQLGAAIEQLSGAALVVPGAIGSAIASFGTLAVGLSGVADAYSAVRAASEESSTGQEQRARATATATQSLRNAVVDEATAQKDLARARRDALRQLQDLNTELRGGQINEAQLVNDLQRAQADLAKGGFTSVFDARDAQLRVEELKNQIVEAHTRNQNMAADKAEADAKGVENSDLVTAATERSTRATQSRVQAQQSLTDATTTSITAADKARDALSKMSPQAADFINTLDTLTPRWDALKKTVSGNLFEGASGSFTTFVDNVLPNLQTGMGNIATAWNTNIKTLLSSLGSDNSQGLLDRILGNTTEAQNRFNNAIDPIVRAVGTLTAAGSDAMPRIADAIGTVADRFADFIEAADKDGRLQEWIDEGLDGLTNLGNIALNLMQSFDSINKAIGGQGLLGTLENLTTRLRDFLASPEGQAKLRDFFTEGRNLLDSWVDILKDLPGMFDGAFDAARSAAGVFMPILKTLTDLLGSHPDLVKNIALAFITWKAINPIVDGVRGAMNLLSTVTTNLGTNFAPVRDKAKQAMKEVDDTFVAAGRPNSGVGKFASVTRGLSAVGGPLALLVTAGLPFVATFVERVISDMDDASEHIRAVGDEAETLVGRLEDITNLTGTGFRKELAEHFQSFDTKEGQGLQGNALDAITQLGLGGQGGQDYITAALPGGEPQYNQIMAPLRDKVRPAVREFIRNQGIDLGATGLTEDEITDAWLGVPSALDKVRNTKQFGQNVVDLSVLQGQVERLGEGSDIFRASLAGQRLNFERSASGGAVSKAQQAQVASAPQRQLRSEFAQYFPNAQVDTDGHNTTIVVTSDTPPGPIPGMSPDTKPEQGVAPNQNKWTYRLSADDASKFTYETGGPTNAGLAVLHDGEFVLSARANKYPLSFKHALNEGRIDPAMIPHFKNGGPFKQDGGADTFGDIDWGIGNEYVKKLPGPPEFVGPQPGGFGSIKLSDNIPPVDDKSLKLPKGPRWNWRSGFASPAQHDAMKGDLDRLLGPLARLFPHFETGGPFPQDQPGQGPGQGPGFGPTNPVQSGGGALAALDDFVQGIQAPINNATSLISAGVNASTGGAKAAPAPGAPPPPAPAPVPAPSFTPAIAPIPGVTAPLPGPAPAPAPPPIAPWDRRTLIGAGVDPNIYTAPGAAPVPPPPAPAPAPAAAPAPAPAPPPPATGAGSSVDALGLPPGAGADAPPPPPPAPTPEAPAPTSEAPAPGAPGSDVHVGTGAPPGPPPGTVPTDTSTTTTNAPIHTGIPIVDQILDNYYNQGKNGQTPTQPNDPLHKWFPWLPWPGEDTDQTVNRVLTNMPDKIKPQTIAYQFGSTLLAGVLGFFGLDQSILSPNNSYNQAAQQTLGFYANKFGSQNDQQSGWSYDANGNLVDANGNLVIGGTSSSSTVDNPQGLPVLQNPASRVPGRFGAQPPTITPAVARSLGEPTLYPTSGPDAYKVPDWANRLASAFGLKASTYADSNTLHQAGYAFDFNPDGGPSDPKGAEKMDAFADYISKNLRGQTLQLIHRDVKSGQEWRIAGGQPVGPGTQSPGYYNADIGGHGDHVHWATDIAPVFADPNAPNSVALTQAGVPQSGTNAILYAANAKGSTWWAAPGDLKTRAKAAYLAAGMPPGEWADFDALIQHESSWQPTIKNPGSTAYGLGQFLDSTWASVGGSKTDDPMQQLQYIFAYLKSRPDYQGSPARAWALWQARSPHWYDQGGILPPGLTLAHNATGQNERVLNPAQTRQYEAMLPHFAEGGGPFVAGAIQPKPPPTPLPRAPDARKIAPRPAPPPAPSPRREPTPQQQPGQQPPPPRPGQPSPPQPGQPAPERPTPAEERPAPQQRPEGQPKPSAQGPVTAAPGADSTDHLLPAVSKGITSGFATAGNIASTAASLAASAAVAGGSFGAAAPAAPIAGQLAGQLAAGLFQQGGKIAVDAANVAASFLVGSVSNIGGDTGYAYGTSYRPQQEQPVTAGNNYSTNYNGGIVVADPNELRRELDLRDNQHLQSAMANR